VTDPTIVVNGLHHAYLSGTPMAQVSLRDIDMHVNRGEIVALVGPTGSGKSTLLQHLNGLLRPQAGQVWVDGQELGNPRTDLRLIRRTVGLVFQRPEDQIFEQYVGDDIAYGPRVGGMSKPALRERVHWAMELVGLDFEQFKDRLTNTLSGGERRKVGLAGVLALRPSVLLLDEPTSGLDPVARADLLERLSALHSEGMTLVLSTHNMDDVASLAGRVYVLQNGHMALNGATRQVFGQVEQLRAFGLDVPAAVSIMAALRERGLSVPLDTLTLAEAENAILEALSRGQTASGGQTASSGQTMSEGRPANGKG